MWELRFGNLNFIKQSIPFLHLNHNNTFQMFGNCNSSAAAMMTGIVAKMMLESTPIIVLDEITAALDNITQESLMKAIEPILKTKTTIIITHRLSTIKNADYVYVLQEHRVVEQGTPEFLGKHGGKYLQFQGQD